MSFVGSIGAYLYFSFLFYSELTSYSSFITYSNALIFRYILLKNKSKYELKDELKCKLKYELGVTIIGIFYIPSLLSVRVINSVNMLSHISSDGILNDFTDIINNMRVVCDFMPKHYQKCE